MQGLGGLLNMGRQCGRGRHSGATRSDDVYSVSLLSIIYRYLSSRLAGADAIEASSAAHPGGRPHMSTTQALIERMKA
ncbi:MAG TPA: hypothetical protein VEX14_03610, partial [Burkholderiaceae bacterium]|nr:hypothetical protein [Burkholderiaceae bacterium]